MPCVVFQQQFDLSNMMKDRLLQILIHDIDIYKTLTTHLI